MDFIEYLRSDISYLAIDFLAMLFFLYLIFSRRDYIVVSFFALLFLALKIILFVGMRPFTAGNDTVVYYYTFQALDGVANARLVGEQNYGNSELIYWPFAAFVKGYVSESFRFFLILSIIVSASLTYAGNRMAITSMHQFDRRKSIFLALFFTYLVFLTYEVAYFGGHIRSAFGVPLAFLAYFFAARRQRLLAVMVFLLALGFHNSVISIAPIILLELLGFKINKSRKTTFILILTLLSAFIFGKYYAIDAAMQVMGDYYAGRYDDYRNYTNFNIDSVFTTGYFWVIIIHVLIFLLIGYKQIHIYAFYYLTLILLFSSTPKISERYFAYILVCLPLLLFESLRIKFKERDSLLLMCAIYFFVNILTITSYGVLSTLGIYSFLNPYS